MPPPWGPGPAPREPDRRETGSAHAARAQLSSPFLSRVCANLRRGRPALPPDRPFSITTESVGGAPFVRLWFRTDGCRRDRQGTCTMCNYGAGAGVSPDMMVASVASALASLPLRPDTTLLLSPSGSMFDQLEVPRAAREQILALAAACPAGAILCETRPETLDDLAVGNFVAQLAGKRTAIEVGLESCDPWILRNCVNKGLDLADYERGIATLSHHGVTSITNVSLGTAFLSPAEAVADAVDTIDFALRTGSDMCVLFPLHARAWTLLGWMWERDIYEPVSMWSLVETLLRLGPDRASRVSISWYRDYSRTGAASTTDVLASPGTCKACEPDVLAALDSYRGTQSYDLLVALSRSACRCRREWEESLTREPGGTLIDRVAKAYTVIGEGVLGAGWWGAHGPEVLDDVRRPV